MKIDLDSIKNLKYREKPVMIKITVKLDKIKKFLSSLISNNKTE